MTTRQCGLQLRQLKGLKLRWARHQSTGCAPPLSGPVVAAASTLRFPALGAVRRPSNDVTAASARPTSATSTPRATPRRRYPAAPTCSAAEIQRPEQSGHRTRESLAHPVHTPQPRRAALPFPRVCFAVAHVGDHRGDALPPHADPTNCRRHTRGIARPGAAPDANRPLSNESGDGRGSPKASCISRVVHPELDIRLGRLRGASCVRLRQSSPSLHQRSTGRARCRWSDAEWNCRRRPARRRMREASDKKCPRRRDVP